MAQDDRNIYEVFRDLVKKICDQIREDEVELMNNIAQFDMRIPQYGSEGIPHLREEIQELIREWKKNKKISPSNKKILADLEKESSRLQPDVLSEEVRTGGYKINLI